MASTTTPKPSLAFFGATGGCAGAALALALKAGYTVHALARTPSKLRKFMSETHSVPDDALNAHLHVVEGSVSDAQAVREVLLIGGTVASVVVFGIGSYPKFNKSLRTPFTLEDPHVCAGAMRAIVEAADGLKCYMRGEVGREQKPLVVTISTTGVTRKTRDVPAVVLPMYHYFLRVMHDDKREMEDILEAATVGSNKEGKKPFGRSVVIRPSLLTDGEPKGLEKVRVGWEAHADESKEGQGPAVGYAINRADVGAWIFAEVIEKEANTPWAGKAVSLTY
ncbi:hypothetical protein EV356DRAFT_524406 [Viridothelium virens]|uniref:NAD(P)-binding domain-containing protein n=1 Tax=Viridothelium virens TaxID=1048519 RepID=A0A6A6H684_VIRVR|nr:hypothetical protein EV356DRAFT_524406 [Viridothelium virens]